MDTIYSVKVRAVGCRKCGRVQLIESYRLRYWSKMMPEHCPFCDARRGLHWISGVQSVAVGLDTRKMRKVQARRLKAAAFYVTGFDKWNSLVRARRVKR